MRVIDLGTMPYRAAWQAQEAAHEAVLGGGEERILFVEHPPVITYGRRAGAAANLLAAPADLDRIGVEIVQSDRGGDITFHGPGQIVAYPILRLNDHGLSVGGYVRALERAIIAALGDFGVRGQRDESAVGVWTDRGGTLAKIAAIGVRIRRGATLHGLALNVTTDLSYFNLIVPCGLASRPVTSMCEILGGDCPDAASVRAALSGRLKQALTPAPA